MVAQVKLSVVVVFLAGPMTVAFIVSSFVMGFLAGPMKESPVTSVVTALHSILAIFLVTD